MKIDKRLMKGYFYKDMKEEIGKFLSEEVTKTENNKVKIGYKEYEIVKKPEVIDLPNECYGKIDYDKETIEISDKYSQKQQNATFLHELIHGIFEKLDLDDLRSNEQIVNQVSSTLYEVIIDNPHIFTMKDI